MKPHPHFTRQGKQIHLQLGVNVAQASFPPELLAERPVASLRTCGITTDVGGVLAELLPTLARRLDQITLEPKQLARDFVEALAVRSAAAMFSP